MARANATFATTVCKRAGVTADFQHYLSCSFFGRNSYYVYPIIPRGPHEPGCRWPNGLHVFYTSVGLGGNIS